MKKAPDRVIEGLRYEGGEAKGLVAGESLGNVTSFGTDADREMLVTTDDGLVFRMVPG